MTADKLIGTWQLISFKSIAGDQVSYPLGEQPGGYMAFSPTRFWVMTTDLIEKLRLLPR
jgi:hypothetical protein